MSICRVLSLLHKVFLSCPSKTAVWSCLSSVLSSQSCAGQLPQAVTALVSDGQMIIMASNLDSILNSAA